MKVLLIGGAGFIGPHVASSLVGEGHQVIVFHRGRASAPTGTTRIIGDRRHLLDHSSELRALRPDVVVDIVLSSVSQARDLLTVFRGATDRIVAVSSCDVYRACAITHRLEEGPIEPLPLTESSALRTKLQTYPPAQVQMLQQVFGWLDAEYDKIPVEQAVLGERGETGTVVRLPMVYGPGDPLRRFQPIVKRVLDGRREILISADLARWRATRGYVEDVGAAIARTATSERAAGRVYNLGEPDALTELEWARLAASVLRWDGQFRLLPDPVLPPFLRAPGNTAQHWEVDTGRVRAELGWAETISRDEAVRRAVEWEATHLPGFTPHTFDYDAEDLALSSSNSAG